MSCQINTTGNILDIAAIRRCLFPTDDLRGSDSWLQLCEVAVCPTGDIIAVGNERRLVILAAKWDNSSSQSQFQITYSGTIHESDSIRAIVILPIVSQTRSSHVVADWTCILVGFDSGYLRFYTDNCDLLLEEQFHCENITSIKCRSQHNPRPDIAPDLHPEEIYVQYQSAVCVIPGNQIFPVLKTCRSELAQVQAKGESLEPFQGDINPKKWGFHDQATINDIAVVGVNLHGTFDHLLTASTCGGFETKYRSSAPYNHLVLAAGSRPFLGYQYAIEGAPMPVFSDVAKAVATKLKSALPGWLTGSKSTVDKQMTVAMQPSESMGCRFGLCDLRRTAINIILSPNHKLAAVSDALGRVLLVDAFRGITLHIFKGYRDAQCSFIQVPDERHSKHRIGNKVALFLVIYSPKKGTLEIFTTQQCKKISTFTASRYSRLIYNNYGLMGFTTTSKSRFICQFDTVFIDNDGQIKEILIPFHFALNEKHNKQARDIHLYKRLKQFLKQENYGTTLDEEVIKIIQELKTNEIKLQAIELLLGEKILSADILLQCVQFYIDNKDEANDKVLITSENAKRLLNFYKFTQKADDLDVENGNSKAEYKMSLDEKQVQALQKLLDLNAIQSQKASHRVEFFPHKALSPSEFVSVFDLEKTENIILKPNQDDILLYNISEHIYNKYVENSSVDALQDAIANSTITTRDMLYLLIFYWVNRAHTDNSKLETDMHSLRALVLLLVSNANKGDLETDYNSTSSFWREFRDILSKSSRSFPALTAAIICKTVCGDLEATLHGDDDNIEFFSDESVAWDLLIGRLEDVSLLNIVLLNKPIAKYSTLPKLKHEQRDISLHYILERGKGSVSELIASWLTTCGINPENIVINDILVKKSLKEEESESSDDDDIDYDELPEQDIMPHKINEVTSEEVLQHLNLLRTQFPYSLNPDIILSNMSWEYALAWQKNIEDLSILEACISCLTQISSCHIRSGIFNFVWNTHLKIIFESTSRLINKVGKLPKERLCRQDTGLSDYQVALFLEVSTKFLDSYVTAVQESFHCEKTVLTFEQLWEKGPQPLVELALQQNQINHDLLHLHYQLSLVLHMMTKFAIKQSKPLNNMFESYMLPMFFTNFQTKAEINWNYTDSRVQTCRNQFLLKIISASVETITMNGNALYAAKHMDWMTKCLDIARLWGVDGDYLRQFEVVKAYTHGFDTYGDSLFNGVEHNNQFGVDLLAIAGKRLKLFLATSPHLCQNMGALGTIVSRYLEQLNEDWCAPSSLEATENIANRSLYCLEDGRFEYRAAEAILEGCQTLQNMYKSNS